MEREQLMEKARANTHYANQSNSEAVKMAAFLDLMHPEMSDDEKRKFIAETTNN